jgi:hypothetical protein
VLARAVIFGGEQWPLVPLLEGNIISGRTLLILVLHAFRSAVTAIPAEGASVNGSYTVMLADFSAIGNPDPEGEYRHYLANGVQISSVVSDWLFDLLFLALNF